MDTVSFMKRLGALLGLALLQVLFLNRINLFGYVTPLFYIWLIIRSDTSMSRSSVLLWSFFLGLAIDLSTGTPGMHAASATLLGLVQPPLINMFVTHDRRDVIRPGRISMGQGAFAGYIFVATVIHHMTYFLLRSIPLEDWFVLVAKVVLSSLLTFVIMLVVDISFSKSDRSRHPVK